MDLLLFKILSILLPIVASKSSSKPLLDYFYYVDDLESDGNAQHVAEPEYYYDYEDEVITPNSFTQTAGDPNYKFSYGVTDDEHGTEFSRSESATDKGTSGQYQVQLPDGRLQIVKYTADENGYRAEVSYESENDHPNAIPQTPTKGVKSQRIRIQKKEVQVHPPRTNIVSSKQQHLPGNNLQHTRQIQPKPIHPQSPHPQPVHPLLKSSFPKQFSQHPIQQQPNHNKIIENDEEHVGPSFHTSRGLQSLNPHNIFFNHPRIAHLAQRPVIPRNRHPLIATQSSGFAAETHLQNPLQFDRSTFITGPSINPIAPIPPSERKSTKSLNPTPRPHPIIRTPQPSHSPFHLPSGRLPPLIPTGLFFNQRQLGVGLPRPHPLIHSHARSSPLHHKKESTIFRRTAEEKAKAKSRQLRSAKHETATSRPEVTKPPKTSC